MKFAVIALCLLGSVAAASAALLVHALRAPAHVGVTTPPVSGDVTVLVARKALPAMTVLDSSVIEITTVPADKAPANCITSPMGVVGKVLTKPIVEGQAFTSAHFENAASAQQLSAVIPSGKRAVGISVTNYAGLGGLLDPGSMVDVMVSLKAADGHEPYTTTLLENVQVLAIEQQTVVSPSKNGSITSSGGDSSGSGRANESHCVTLLVDSQQAKALQVAMEKGTLSLALRNPMDVTVNANGDDQNTNNNANAQPQKTVQAESPRWEMTIMRGGAVETKSFPMPEAQ